MSVKGKECKHSATQSATPALVTPRSSGPVSARNVTECEADRRHATHAVHTLSSPPGRTQTSFQADKYPKPTWSLVTTQDAVEWVCPMTHNWHLRLSPTVYRSKQP